MGGRVKGTRAQAVNATATMGKIKIEQKKI